MTWNIGDHGFEMTLAAQVPSLIEHNLRPWVEDWLGGLGLFPGDIASWAIHPGGPRILQAAQSALGLSNDQVTESLAVLREFGNMSSPTILFILSRLAASRAPRPCLALAFGPGLVAEAALFG
jgi:predicted naringenin-chalcone synthase